MIFKHLPAIISANLTSLAAENDIPLEVISRQLGHSDSKVTRDIYLHVTDRIRKADNAKLDAVSFL